MKKYLVILIALAIIVPVTAAHAFSLGDVLNFGARLLHKENQIAQTEVKTQTVQDVAPFSVYGAEAKFNNWAAAYDKRDLTKVIFDSRNLYFTDGELTYLINQELASATDPYAKDITVNFTDNLAKVSGYSMLKNFTGSFYLEAKPTMAHNRISLQVTKARFRNFYFPAFIAQAVLNSQLRQSIDFLYSDADYQNLTLTFGSGFIQLDYAK